MPGTTRRSVTSRLAPRETITRAPPYYSQLKAAGDLGSNVPDYPEQYININASSTVSIIKSMIRQQCAAKGFDGVEPDIDDSYTDSTGFGITEAGQY